MAFRILHSHFVSATFEPCSSVKPILIIGRHYKSTGSRQIRSTMEKLRRNFGQVLEKDTDKHLLLPLQTNKQS